MDFSQIRRLMSSWNETTYGESLTKVYNLDRNISCKTMEILGELGIVNSAMNGNSVQSLPRITEGRSIVTYTNIFNRMVSGNGYFSPSYYIYNIVKDCCEWRAHFEANNNRRMEEYQFTALVKGTVCRGLRTLASFFREKDLASKISTAFTGARIITDPNIDIGQHTDVLIEYNGVIFHLWSYQSSYNGLTNGADKLCGRRGNIPNGVHLLCPIDIYNINECENICGWRLYSERYTNMLANIILNFNAGNVDKYNVFVQGQPLNNVKEYMKNPHIFVKG